MTTTSVTIESSVESRPMEIGGTNNAAVAGINLTSAELTRIVTSSSGSITFGDTNQTGNITFAGATTAGATTDVVESVTGAGAIVLDDSNGIALDGNGGTVTLTPGTGQLMGTLATTSALISTHGFTATGLTLNLGLGFAPSLGNHTHARREHRHPHHRGLHQPDVGRHNHSEFRRDRVHLRHQLHRRSPLQRSGTHRHPDPARAPPPSPPPALTSPSPPPSGNVVINDPTGGDTIPDRALLPACSIGSITYTLGNSAPVSLTGVTSFTYNGLGGNDTMTVSKVNGGPLVSGDIVFVCGPGSNTAEVVDAEGGSVRTTPGVITFDDPQSVDYTNVSTIDINNASVNSMAGPDTADRAIAFAGLTAQERRDPGPVPDRPRARPAVRPSWTTGSPNSPHFNGLQNVTNAIEQSQEGTDRLVRSWCSQLPGAAGTGRRGSGLRLPVAQRCNGITSAQPDPVVRGVLRTGATNDLLRQRRRALRCRRLYQVLLNRNGDAPGRASRTPWWKLQFAGRLSSGNRSS